MNLHINLIEEQEKRRGGSPHLLFILRAVGASVPIVVLLILAHLIVSLRMAQTELDRTRQRTEDKKPQLALSSEVKKQERLYRDMLAQLDGWKAMRLDWHRQLAALRQTVPLEVQLTSLSFSQTVAFSNNAPVAAHLLLVRGKTGGAAPENNLTRFRLNLLKAPDMSAGLAEVEVPEGAFVEDTSPNARPMDRIFELNCRYKPREFQ